MLFNYRKTLFLFYKIECGWTTRRAPQISTSGHARDLPGGNQETFEMINR